MKIIFICAPYTAPTKHGINMNIRRAEQIARELASHGLGFICPHTNSAHMETVDIEPEFWYEMYLAILETCDALYLSPAWESSKGCRGELKLARRCQMPIFSNIESIVAWAGKHARRIKGAI